MRGVSMRPGATQLTVIPCGPSSRARLFAQPVTPGRIVFESARCGTGSFTAEEVMQMTRPAGLRSRCGSASRTSRTAGRSRSSNAASRLSSVISAALPGGGPPEFQTTMSIPPKASSVFETSRSRSAAFVTSPRTASAPIRSASNSSCSRLRASMATLAPSSASASAEPRPRPDEAPQTIAVLPRRPRSMRRDGSRSACAPAKKPGSAPAEHVSSLLRAQHAEGDLARFAREGAGADGAIALHGDERPPLWLVGERVHGHLDPLPGSPPYELQHVFSNAIDGGAEVSAIQIGRTRDLTDPVDLVRENFPYLRR